MKEAYMREGPDRPDRGDDQMLSKLACKCAKMRIAGLCTTMYHPHGCGECHFNVFNYMGDARRAMLMVTHYTIVCENVEDGAKRHEARVNGTYDRLYGPKLTLTDYILKTIKWAAIIGIVAFVGYRWHVANENYDRKYGTAARTVTYEQQERPTPLWSDSNLRQTLREVSASVYDISGDGLVNCQDYVALFMRKYEGEAQIMYNEYIGPTGHVFIRVWTPDGWLYVEAQNTTGYLMREAWPEWESVRHLNQEMTARFRK